MFSTSEDFFDKYCDADGDLRCLDDELHGLLLHGHPPPFSEGDFVFGFSLLETPAVGLDELKGVGDELVGALGDPLVGFPDVSVEGSDDCDPCPFVEAPCCDVCELLEANDTDPAGLLLGAVKGDVEGCHRIPLRAVKHFGVRT